MHRRISWKTLRTAKRRTCVSAATFIVTLSLHGVWVSPIASPEFFEEVTVGITQTEAREVRAVEKPSRLRIPRIKLDTAVEGIGLVGKKRLDTPKKPQNVGWYTLGPRPGERGSAVIDGHLDLHGKPAAFWELRKLKKGDTITVVDSAGTERTFRVTRTVVYDVKAAPMKTIFASDDGKFLNLITCAGTWSKKLGHYDKRLVVYSELLRSDQYPVVSDQKKFTN